MGHIKKNVFNQLCYQSDSKYSVQIVVFPNSKTGKEENNHFHKCNRCPYCICTAIIHISEPKRHVLQSLTWISNHSSIMSTNLPGWKANLFQHL